MLHHDSEEDIKICDRIYSRLSNLSLIKAVFPVVPKRLKYKEVTRIAGASFITSVQSAFRETGAFAKNTELSDMRNVL